MSFQRVLRSPLGLQFSIPAGCSDRLRMGGGMATRFQGQN
jgi:hypothetical protein